MRIKELKKILEGLDENMHILVNDSAGMQFDIASTEIGYALAEDDEYFSEEDLDDDEYEDLLQHGCKALLLYE